jgi:hypothetical protein
MQRIQRFVEEAVQVEHVGAAPREERLQNVARGIARLHAASFQIDKQRAPLCGILRVARQFRDKSRDAIADTHD